MTIDFLILIKLVLAHFLGDFCFQSRSLVEKKEQGDIWAHLLHAVIHAVLAYVLVADLRAWYIPLLVGISHFVLDLLKSQYKKKNADENGSTEQSGGKNMLYCFITDQLFHLLVLLGLWLYMTGQALNVYTEIGMITASQNFWIYLIGIVFILKPTSVILGMATRKWESGREAAGLTDAGQWIGYLERILILIFMCISVYQAIGFVLAAKSIYRFGELKEGRDVKKTEYIMIGTFLSFTIAIVDGLVLVYLAN